MGGRYALIYSPLSAGHWEDVQNRRELFCEVALRRRFDPLVPANWYQTSLDSLSNVKVCQFVTVFRHILFN